MSKYSKEEQVEIVKTAMNLQATIESEQAQISSIQKESFKLKPAEPTHQKARPVNVNYPVAPKSSYTFTEHINNDSSFLGKMFTTKGLIIDGIICVLTMGIAIPVFAILFIVKFFEYSSKRSEFNKQLANTPEYLQARAEAERVASEEQARLQQQLDDKYAVEMSDYNTALAQYNTELNEWESKRSIKLSILNEDLSLNKQALAELYDSTLLIPKNNRSLNQLVYLYDDMSTSEHDFERSLDMLNANMQLAKTEQINQQMSNMTSVMYQGFSATLEAIDYGNSELDEIRGTLGKVRRDMNIANVGAAVQRRNLRKEVKATNSKLDDILNK
ncbi:MAG: hypothetical protein IJJ41_02020 [Clostridia bacterium]|nr:hypothetical protein [Clostridia bacterium]